MTTETELPPPSKATPSFGTMLVRVKNLLRQGALDLAQGQDGEPVRAAEAIAISGQGQFLALSGQASAGSQVPVSAQILAGLAARANPRPVDLVFQDGSCIDVAFSVPAAPLEELRQIIATEVQFRSPFAEGAALAFWTAREQPGGRWQIQAAVVLKTRIAELLAELDANAIPIGRVWRDGAAVRFAAEPDWATAPAPTPRALTVLSALPGPLKLTLAGSLMFLASAAALSLSLAVGGGRLSAAAEAARASLSADAQASASLGSLDRSLARSADRLALTGRLTNLMPDGFWLDQLAIERETVTLTGFGPSAAELTRLLTTLPELADIAFASPVTRDNTQSLERYRISATLVGSQP